TDKHNKQDLRRSENERDPSAEKAPAATRATAMVGEIPHGSRSFSLVWAGCHQRYRVNGSHERYPVTAVRRFPTRNCHLPALNRFPEAESHNFLFSGVSTTRETLREPMTENRH